MALVDKWLPLRVCVVSAGIARCALIVVPLTGLGAPLRETIYLSVDLAILLSIVGLWSRFAGELGHVSEVGLVAAILGILIIRTGDRSLVGAFSYPGGAALLTAGLAIFFLPFIRSGGLRMVVSAAFLLSLSVGAVAAVAGLATAGFVIGSALFGAGLIAVGTLLSPSNGQIDPNCRRPARNRRDHI